MTPPAGRGRRTGRGGVLAALAVWAVILAVIAAVFTAMNALGATSGVSATVGVPLCVALLYGIGLGTRRLRTTRAARTARTARTEAPASGPAEAVDHGAVEAELWAVRGLGTTWLTRGGAYWLRRVLIWLGWAAGTALVVAITIGVIIGATPDQAPRYVVAAVVATVNAAVVAGLLLTGWPTPERLAVGRSRAGRSSGAGASVGIGLVGARTLSAAVIPMLILGAAGALLAMLVLSSLPMLTEERRMMLRRADTIARTRPRGTR